MNGVQLIDYFLPPGVICMWSGTLATIPTGWALCDGTGTTPNLVAKFIRGVATAGTDPGTTGGADSVTLTGAQSGTSAHSHTINDSGHTHTYAGKATNYTPETYAKLQYQGTASGTTNSATTGITINNSATGNASSSHENMPAYYALAYIQKQ
jgi:microcystin-dependent protein